MELNFTNIFYQILSIVMDKLLIERDKTCFALINLNIFWRVTITKSHLYLKTVVNAMMQKVMGANKVASNPV